MFRPALWMANGNDDGDVRAGTSIILDPYTIFAGTVIRLGPVYTVVAESGETLTALAARFR